MSQNECYIFFPLPLVQTSYWIAEMLEGFSHIKMTEWEVRELETHIGAEGDSAIRISLSSIPLGVESVSDELKSISDCRNRLTSELWVGTALGSDPELSKLVNGCLCQE